MVLRDCLSALPAAGTLNVQKMCTPAPRRPFGALIFAGCQASSGQGQLRWEHWISRRVDKLTHFASREISCHQAAALAQF